MDEDAIIENLELLGYSGMCLTALRQCIKEVERRKAIIHAGEITKSDLIAVSVLFDSINNLKKRK